MIMKPLQENYQMFVRLGICSSVKPLNQWIKLCNISTLIFCPFFLPTGLIAGFVFMVKNFKIDLPNTICACFQVVATMTGVYVLIAIYVKRAEIKVIFHTFQTFYDASK